MYIQNGKVLRHEQAGEDYRILAMELPAIAAAAQPGQFIHLRVPSLHDAVLRRPFSICRADNGVIEMLYKTVGRGTAAMEPLQPGQILSVMGPLGNGFPLQCREGTRPALVAGGYGVAPLAFLAARLNRQGDVFVGGASRKDILCIPEFEKLGWTVHIATEDGTLGTRGLVTAVVTAWLSALGPGERPEFFACGPNGMLKAVGDMAEDRGADAWLSLDRHMGCGVGACLACVQRVRRDGVETLARVCKEGPVFAARDIVWTE